MIEFKRDIDPDGLQFSYVRWILVVTIGHFQFQVSRAGEW